MNKLFHFLLALALLGWASPALSGGGGEYALTDVTVDGGGGVLRGDGEFVLDGTVGQPDAGSLEGTSFQLEGGFWSSSLAPLVRLLSGSAGLVLALSLFALGHRRLRRFSASA